MPIHHSKSPKAFQENIRREEHFGRPEKQAVAVAYAEADRAKHRDKDAAYKRRLDDLIESGEMHG